MHLCRLQHLEERYASSLQAKEPHFVVPIFTHLPPGLPGSGVQKGRCDSRVEHGLFELSHAGYDGHDPSLRFQHHLLLSSLGSRAGFPQGDHGYPHKQAEHHPGKNRCRHYQCINSEPDSPTSRSGHGHEAFRPSLFPFIYSIHHPHSLYLYWNGTVSGLFYKRHI